MCEIREEGVYVTREGLTKERVNMWWKKVN